MNIHLPQILFLVGMSGYVVIRSVYQKSTSGRESTVNRSSPLDRIMILVVVLGQIVLPLAYVFSPGLDFANYQSGPAWLGLGAFAWLLGLWIFWRAHADLGKNWSVTGAARGASIGHSWGLPSGATSAVCRIPTARNRLSAPAGKLARGPVSFRGCCLTVLFSHPPRRGHDVRSLRRSLSALHAAYR